MTSDFAHQPEAFLANGLARAGCAAETLADVLADVHGAIEAKAVAIGHGNRVLVAADQRLQRELIIAIQPLEIAEITAPELGVGVQRIWIPQFTMASRRLQASSH